MTLPASRFPKRSRDGAVSGTDFIDNKYKWCIAMCGWLARAARQAWQRRRARIYIPRRHHLRRDAATAARQSIAQPSSAILSWSHFEAGISPQCVAAISFSSWFTIFPTVSRFSLATWFYYIKLRVILQSPHQHIHRGIFFRNGSIFLTLTYPYAANAGS